MKYFSRLISLAIAMFIVLIAAPSFASAWYPLFHSGEGSVALTSLSAFVSVDGDNERLVLAPSFQGTLHDFALVVVTPPNVHYTAASQTIFQELSTVLSISDPSPEVIGTVTPTLLGASSLSSLRSWLDDLGYSYNDEDFLPLESLVAQGFRYSLFLIKIPEDAPYDDDGYYGTLPPFELSYSSENPELVFSNAAGGSVYLYTLSQGGVYQTELQETDVVQESLHLEDNTLGDHCLSNNSCDASAWTNEYYLGDEVWLSARVLPETALGVTTLVLSSPSVTNLDEYAHLTGGTRFLRYGVSGEDVRDLQRFLNQHLGISLNDDGVWGPLTHQAVQEFQRSNNLTIDGIVGPQTRAFIASLLMIG